MTSGPSTPVEDLVENRSPLFARTRHPERCTAIRGRQILAGVSVTLRDALEANGHAAWQHGIGI